MCIVRLYGDTVLQMIRSDCPIHSDRLLLSAHQEEREQSSESYVRPELFRGCAGRLPQKRRSLRQNIVTPAGRLSLTGILRQPSDSV